MYFTTEFCECWGAQNSIPLPCSSKKLAEKDAAAAALLWLKGETHSYSRNTDSSVLLKKSKTINQNRIPVLDDLPVLKWQLKGNTYFTAPLDS
ncbi:hypothetical protein OIU85_010246 [Salix viminalis]|uniref:DRBM domain-containing protein n=1 Tax=Salix viminalis TaxID=40686 RepID=A0A9Q0SHJ1_SALVM|nr:hypothetical protein OIU85_010246 [Salix viminalis]